MSCAPAVAVAMWDNNYIYCELELQSCYDPHTTYFRESVVLCFRQRQVSRVSTYTIYDFPEIVYLDADKATFVGIGSQEQRVRYYVPYAYPP
jgi:hypothetical protein